MKLLDKLGGGVEKVFAAISGVSLLAMFLVLFVQVLLRYFFRIGIIWTDEFSRYLMLWIIMLGASVMTFDDSHIRISLLEDVAPVLKKGFKVIRYLIICVLRVQCDPDLLQYGHGKDEFQLAFFQHADSDGLCLSVLSDFCGKHAAFCAASAYKDRFDAFSPRRGGG